MLITIHLPIHAVHKLPSSTFHPLTAVRCADRFQELHEVLRDLDVGGAVILEDICLCVSEHEACNFAPNLLVREADWRQEEGCR